MQTLDSTCKESITLKLCRFSLVVEDFHVRKSSHNAPLVFFVVTGVEEAMGAENSGVLYALWSYPAQAADELSFREGDMVTILQKPEGSSWWWASLCGREGLVPNNYFGVSCPFLMNSAAFTDFICF